MDMFPTISNDFDAYPGVYMDLINISSMNEQFQNNLFSFQNYHLDNNEINRICEYLENPTKKGVWFFSFDWIEEGGITSYIKNEIEDFVRNDSIQNSSQNNKKNRSVRKISRSFLGKKEVLLEFTNHFSFIFSLFTYIYLEEMKSQLDREDIIFQDRYLQIIQVLDIEKFKEKYQDAYNIFKDEIYFDKFNPNTTGEQGIFKTRDSIIVSTYNSEGTRTSLCTLSDSPLEKLKNFFQNIGKVNDSSIRPEYSPEEKVFTPYFSFLEIAFPYFIHESKVARLFKKAIDTYEDRNYEYCIITLGLIVEKYLTQIYETFHRDILPKKSTIGETYSLIDNKINNQSQSKIVFHAPKINLLCEKANNLLSDKSETDDVKRNKDTLELIREVLLFIQDDKKHTTYLINNINKKESRVSLFPEHIRENINELIRYRNATSHNSSVPIGQYEAQRMVYCCITLIMWWKKEKDSINWKDDQMTIIEKVIERNKRSSGKL